MDRDLISGRVKKYSYIHLIQIDFAGHKALYVMDTGSFDPREQLPGCEADRLPPSSAEII
jgi:hypothetical protein